MSKRLILHIGSPKTGTTSIQSFLVKNRARLKKNGYLVPNLSARWKNIASAETGYFLQRVILQELGFAPRKHSAVRINTCKDEILSQMEGFDGSVILSEERLWYLFGGNDHAVDKLKEFTDGMGFTEYKIFAYVRRQDLFAKSYWEQFLKTHPDRGLTFKEYLESDMCKDSEDYNDIIGKLERAFGRESIELRIYDRKQLIDGDSVTDFMDMLGLDINDGFNKLVEEKNGRIEGNAFNELKRLAALCPSYAADKENYLRSIITRFSSENKDANPGGVFTPQERAEYLAKFEEGNNSIARRYFDRDELFGPNKVDDQPKWEPATGELASDAFLVLVEALSEERNKRKELEKALCKQTEQLESKIGQLEDKINYLERVNRNSLGLKVERALRGAKMKRED